MGEGSAATVAADPSPDGHGPRGARPGRGRTLEVARRARPGDIAVVDHADIDGESARALIAAGVAGLVDVAPAITGRYPTSGTTLLAEAGSRCSTRSVPRCSRRCRWCPGPPRARHPLVRRSARRPGPPAGRASRDRAGRGVPAGAGQPARRVRRCRRRPARRRGRSAPGRDRLCRGSSRGPTPTSWSSRPARTRAPSCGRCGGSCATGTPWWSRWARRSMSCARLGCAPTRWSPTGCPPTGCPPIRCPPGAASTGPSSCCWPFRHGRGGRGRARADPALGPHPTRGRAGRGLPLALAGGARLCLPGCRRR